MARSRKHKGSFRTRILLGIFFGTASLLLALALAAFLMDGNWRQPPAALVPRMGRLNYATAAGILRVLGVFGGWLVPLGMAAVAGRLFAGKRLPGTGSRGLGIAAAAALLASAVTAFPGGDLSAERALAAGWLGTALVHGLRFLFGGVGTAVVLGGASLAFLAAIGIPVFSPLARLGVPLARAAGWARERGGQLARTVGEAFASGGKERGRASSRDRAEETTAGSVRIVHAGRDPDGASGEPASDSGDDDEEEWEEEDGEWEEEDEDEGDEGEEEEEEDGEDEEEDAPGETPVVVLPPKGGPAPGPQSTSVDVIGEIQRTPGKPYQPPPRNFLDRDDDEEADVEARDELLAGAKTLETALRDFGVRGKVTQIEPGPVITRYEVEPAPGQKVAPIASLSDDLALALRARQIRIVAPIPGKAAVGIEVPNPNPRIVHLGSLLESKEYSDAPSPLTIALGRTISGEPFCLPLDRMPHLLVAGATGSGKSICINTLITSIIYRAGPEDVRFIMVDPKMLELTAYLGLPHLIPPVVSLPKDVVRILKWVVAEMESRYRALAHVGVRHISDHNRRLEEEGAPKLPYLVVIIDELADLMLSNVRGEIEESIARLAQMARAVGIHVVLATQRPSVDVITGVIKANFPSRIAFQVPTRTDSRTILDSIGAERLLGKGDMLYLGVGMSEPMRVHGSFISTEETNDIVEWLKARNPEADESEGEGPLEDGGDLFPRDREDDLFEEAARILVAHQQGSISLLQRRLKIGYARAARLVDMMEEAGIVGPFTGSKAREILVGSLEELDSKLANARRTPLGGKTPG